MPFLKNLVINLQATGTAAVMIVLILSILALGLWGEGELAKSALTVLTILVGALVTVLTVQAYKT